MSFSSIYFHIMPVASQRISAERGKSGGDFQPLFSSSLRAFGLIRFPARCGPNPEDFDPQIQFSLPGAARRFFAGMEHMKINGLKQAIMKKHYIVAVN